MPTVTTVQSGLAVWRTFWWCNSSRQYIYASRRCVGSKLGQLLPLAPPPRPTWTLQPAYPSRQSCCTISPRCCSHQVTSSSAVHCVFIVIWKKRGKILKLGPLLIGKSSSFPLKWRHRRCAHISRTSAKGEGIQFQRDQDLSVVFSEVLGP